MIVRAAGLALRHRWKVFLLALVLTVPSMVLAAGMYARLRTEGEELLPVESPAVEAVRVLRERLPSAQHLGIIVRGPEAGRPAEFAARLAERIALYPPDVVRMVRADVRPERRFMEQRWPLYLSLDQLKELSARIRRQIRGLNPFHVDLLGREGAREETAAPLRPADPYQGRFPGDRLVSPDGRVALVLVFPSGIDTGTSKVTPLVERIQADVAALAPGDLEVGYAGDVAINVEELSALRSDLAVSSLLVVLAVAGVLIAYFRSAWCLAALALPLFAGTAWAFGLSSIDISSLNTSTAFLGSIVLGNGINPGIVLLARYVEERRRGRQVRESVEGAVAGTWAGTLCATTAAAAAYGSLTFGAYRGFSEFGLLGALGMACCWLAAYALIPPLVAVLDRKPHAVAQLPRTPHSQPAISWVARRPGAVLAGAGVAIAAAALSLTRLDGSRIEYDMTRLRSRQSLVSGEGYWNQRLNEVLGQNLTAVALLANRAADVPELSRRLGAQVRAGALAPVASRIIAPSDVVPPDQEAKLVELREIARRLPPELLEILPAEMAAAAGSLARAALAGPVSAADVPPLLSMGMVERDGVFGRTLLMVQSLDSSTWNGRLLIDATRELRSIGASVEPAAHVAGGFIVAAEVFETLEAEAPRVTVLAFASVVVAVVLAFRRLGPSLVVLASLVSGVILLGAAVVMLDLRINFLSFMAFPITFGIGVDYAVNVLQRARQEPGGGGLRSTGGAVAVCSATTIIGYSSLLLAQNQALFSFGLLAVLGELACLVVAVVALPSALALMRSTR